MATPAIRIDRRLSRSVQLTELAATKSNLPLSEDVFTKLSELVLEESGIDLSPSKIDMLRSRLSRRLRILNIPSFEDYLTHLYADRSRRELQKLIDTVTTNVTHFFREPHHFDDFEREVIPRLLTDARAGRPVRVWSAGCSSGEEPFSIALTVANRAPELMSLNFRILATDINDGVIAKSRLATFPIAALGEHVGERIQERHVSFSGDNATITDEIRRMISFKHLNLTKDWPLRMKYHAIFCRNVLIYFPLRVQERVVSLFARRLVTHGALYLGHSERVPSDLAGEFVGRGMTSYRKV